MTIDTLCEKIINNERQESINLISELNVLDLNATHSTLRQRPIDIAARYGRGAVLECLRHLGVTLSRPAAIRNATQNVVVSMLVYNDLRNMGWLLNRAPLADLADEGIVAEHIRAGMKLARTEADDLSKEDSEGLLPVHYAILAANPHFQSWIPAGLADDFPNHKIGKNGLYHNITNAWFFANSDESIKLLKHYSNPCLHSIDLSVRLNIPLNTAQSLLFRLLRNNYGKEFLSKLRSFADIDWNSQEQGISAAWELCVLHYGISLLFQLPKEKLAQLDWNVAPTEDSTTHCLRSGYMCGEDEKNLTLAALIAKNDEGKKLLAALPAEIINEKINWTISTAKVKASESRAINRFVCVWKQLDTPSRTLLDKLSIKSLSQLVNELSVSDRAYQYILLALVERLMPLMPKNAEELIRFSDKDIQEKLDQFSTLFKELETYLCHCTFINAQVNGLKGRLIFCMSATDRTSTLLLQMNKPFFRATELFDSINSPRLRVQAIAMTYSMRGLETDITQASLQSYSLFKAIDKVKGSEIPRSRSHSF